jgi:hypothetical protein
MKIARFTRSSNQGHKSSVRISTQRGTVCRISHKCGQVVILQNALYRNTTEAINAVMYDLLTEFRDGDNVVTTLLEHNSNYVPWYAMCAEILPRLARRVECRLARFDPVTAELDLDHLASLIDARIKLCAAPATATGPDRCGSVHHGAGRSGQAVRFLAGARRRACIQRGLAK